MIIKKEEYKKYIKEGAIITRTFRPRNSNNDVVYEMEVIQGPHDDAFSMEYWKESLKVIKYKTVNPKHDYQKKPQRYYINDLFNGVVEILNPEEVLANIYISVEEFSIS